MEFSFGVVNLAVIRIWDALCHCFPGVLNQGFPTGTWFPAPWWQHLWARGSSALGSWLEQGREGEGRSPGLGALLPLPPGLPVAPKQKMRSLHSFLRPLSAGFLSAFWICSTAFVIEVCFIIVRPKCFTINFSLCLEVHGHCIAVVGGDYFSIFVCL